MSSPRIAATRFHDISCGHRVVGHEGKCRNIHGHNYRIHFTVVRDYHVSDEEMDPVGRVVDFDVIKARLCQYLESFWDHKTLIWSADPKGESLYNLFPGSVVKVPFNPTAENMAKYLVDVVGPTLLKTSGVYLAQVIVEETRKCSASYQNFQEENHNGKE